MESHSRKNLEAEHLLNALTGVAAAERDAENLARTQLKDDRITQLSGLDGLLDNIAASSQHRAKLAESLIEMRGGSFGDAFKVGLAHVAGTFTGLQGIAADQLFITSIKEQLSIHHRLQVEYISLKEIAALIEDEKALQLVSISAEPISEFLNRCEILLPKAIRLEISGE